MNAFLHAQINLYSKSFIGKEIHKKLCIFDRILITDRMSFYSISDFIKKLEEPLECKLALKCIYV